MVILLTGLYPKQNKNIAGGVESVCINLSRALASQPGTEVHFLAFHKDKKTYYESQKILPTLTIHHFSEKNMRNKRMFYLTRGRKILRDLFREIDADLVHFQGNGPHLLLSPVIPRNKLVLTRHANIGAELALQPTLKGKLIYWLNLIIERKFAPRFIGEISISNYNAELVKNKNTLLVRVIPNPLSSMFSEGAPGTITPNSLLFVGAISPRKGLLDLICAMEAAKQKGADFQLTVAGPITDNSYFQIVSQKIKEAGLAGNVNFCGSKTTAELADLYASTFLFVLPSHQESAPMVIAEAQAAGAAVIAASTGGVPEMIENGVTGMLFTKGDVSQLSELLVSAVRNPLNSAMIRKRGQEFAKKKYHPDIVAKQTLSFYKELIGKSSQ